MEAALRKTEALAPATVHERCSLWGSVPFGGAPTLDKLEGVPTWPGVLRAATCTIAIDGWFVVDGRLRLGRAAEERRAIAAQLVDDLEGFLARVENGFFNIVIHDRSRAETRFVSDRFGALPLYLLRKPGKLLFASTYAGLKALSGRPLSPDPVGIAELYWFGYPLGDRTSWVGVRQMPAATVVRVRWADGVERHALAAPRLPEPRLPQSPTALAAELVGAMATAAKRLHRPEARYGAKVSAGMDSRLILATWPDSRVRAYTHGFAGSAEMRLAGQLAAALGMPHTSVPIQGDFFTRLQLPLFEDYGLAEFFHRASLERQRADGVQLVLDGLAGDMVLGGLAMKRGTSLVRQALGIAPPAQRVRASDDEVAQQILPRMRVPDVQYRPVTADAVRQLESCWAAIRADMAEEVRQARRHAPGGNADAHALHAHIIFRNRTRRYISLQGTSCRPDVETLYPFLDRDVLCWLGRIPPDWAANKRLYLEIYRHFLPAVRNVPGLFSLLPYSLPRPVHYAGRVVRYGLERAGMRLSLATGGRLNGWAADSIQWRRWIAFDRELHAALREFMRAAQIFDAVAFDRSYDASAAPAVSGTRLMLTTTYCGYFR
jgi:asparagine synthetase B (glutamine-hydrolysing)